MGLWAAGALVTSWAGSAPDVAAPEGPLADAVDRVESAIARADDDPGGEAAELAAALLELERDPVLLAEDPAAADLRMTALLTLSRAYLASDEPARAREWMDEAIRTARGDPLPVEALGPGLTALHRERAEALASAPRGELSVSCALPCRILVNERPAPPHLRALPPGRYRVHVEPLEPQAAPALDVAVEVTGHHALGWPAAPRPPAPAPDARSAPAGAPKRLLPRWSEIVAIVAGAAALGAGAVLLAIDGRCPGGDDPLDVEACPRVYTTRTGGLVTMAAAGAVLVVGGVMLTVDEVRARGARDARVGLRFTARF